jgi:alpha-galactosidase
VLWNYAYNLPLGRFQKPRNWDDPDFLIGGDGGMTLPETRSQMALWSMMSSPLILSSDVDRLTTDAIAVLGNPALMAVDQDPQGRMATLVRRTPTMDMLFKSLADGDYAVAVLNRGPDPLHASIAPADLGFAANQSCDQANTRGEQKTTSDHHGSAAQPVRQPKPRESTMYYIAVERILCRVRTPSTT